jgi:hypothetical protein
VKCGADLDCHVRGGGILPSLLTLQKLSPSCFASTSQCNCVCQHRRPQRPVRSVCPCLCDPMGYDVVTVNEGATSLYDGRNLTSSRRSREAANFVFVCLCLWIRRRKKGRKKGRKEGRKEERKTERLKD